MIDLEVLTSVGTTNERLKEIFTATLPPKDSVSEEEYKKKEQDVKTREFWQDRIQARLTDKMTSSLNNQQIYSAVDLAWDSRPINKQIYPLMQYAQGFLDVGACAKSLSTLGCGDRYVTKNEKGEVVGIDLPSFVETEVNLIRSVVTRRLAAQSNRFSNLWPLYVYEPRFTDEIGKLQADLVSQRMDIMADQFDYRHHDVQVDRDTFLYGHCVAFSRCSWEREIQWAKDPKATELQTEEERKGEKVPVKAIVVKEGLSFHNPHVSRNFWDNAYPLASINTDTGCTYIGNWDVMRKGDIEDNPHYWNKTDLSYSSNVINLFSNYAQYFSQYYCTIKAPQWHDASTSNDRVNNIGFYSTQPKDAAVVVANYFEKVIPKSHGIGDYPYPVWIRFVQAGDKTIIFSELYPYTPAAVDSYNENDNRQVNISVAHELMGYQDQMTNLLSYLLLSMKADCHKMLLLNIDVLSPEQVKQYRAEAKAKVRYNEVQVIECSFSKMAGLGIDPTRSVQFIETRTGTQVNIIFQAMTTLLSIVERMMALSPQEQGQPAPRETTATENTLIAATTESVFSFKSDSHDEYRAAKKRMLYYAWMAFGSKNFKLPVANRYSEVTVKAAGLEIANHETQNELNAQPGAPIRDLTVIGTKEKLVADYIFTTRDGSERAVNSQVAGTLINALQLMQQPGTAQLLPKSKLYEILNEIFRKLSGIDLNLQLKPGESDAVGIDANQQVHQILEQLTQQAEQTAGKIQGLTQIVEQLTALMEQSQKRIDEVSKLAERNGVEELKAKVDEMVAMEKVRRENAIVSNRIRLDELETKHGLAMDELKTAGGLAIEAKKAAASKPTSGE